MALYDNKMWMLSHIYHSFCTGDDSGLSEMVLASGNFKEDLRTIADSQGLSSFVDCLSEDEDEDDDGGGGRSSPDIRGEHSRMQPPHSTKMQGAKVEREKIPEVKTKTVVWKKSSAEAEELEEIFPRKQLKQVGQDEPDGVAPAKVAKPVSLLSHLLDNLTMEDTNPWLEYGKLDATGNLDPKCGRKMAIYFPFSCDEDELKYLAVNINCYRDVSVSDLLGLSLFLYTQERRQPRVCPPLDNFCLCMCEEEGVVDSDFPPLIMSDPLSKYGFSVLAVVRVQRPDGDVVQESHAVCVTLHMPDGTFSQLEIQDKTITLGELTSLGLERRKYLQKARYKFNYHLEAPDQPGIALDPKLTLSSQDGNTEFYIVRDNSKRVSELQSTGTLSNFLEAHLYQSFNVEIFTKMRTKVDIHLGISGDKVEIDPRQQSSSAKFWSKQKAVSYALDKVVSCEILEKMKRSDNRVVFKMVYLSDNGWSQKDFESDREVAEEVVQKLNYLLDQKQSVAREQRREYLQNKQKKKQRLRTLTN